MGAVSWASGVSGNWSTGADWSTASPPGSASAVTIGVAGTYTVTIGAAASALTLAVTDVSATLSVLAGASLNLGNGTSVINGALIDAGTLVAGAGDKLAVNAAASLAGALEGSGDLATGGTTSITGTLDVGGGLIWTNNGVVTQNATVAFGTQANDKVKIINATGASWNLAADNNIGNDYGTTDGLVNDGSLNMTASSGTSAIDVAISGEGSINVSAGGTLEFQGGGNFAGTIKGSGTLQFNGGTSDISSGTNIAIADMAVTGGALTISDAVSTGCLIALSGGSLELSASVTLTKGFTQTGGTLSVDSGDTLTLDGKVSLGGMMGGPGTLITSTAASITGGTLYVGGDLSWINGNTVTQTVAIAFGTMNSDTVSIGNNSGAVWDITADTGISNDYGSSNGFANAGTFEKTGGTGISVIAAAFSSTGVIDAATGTIEFSGGGSIGGTLEGAGTIEFNGNGDTIGTGTSVTVADLEVTGGTLTIGENLTTAAAITVSAVLNIGGNDSFSRLFDLSSGTLVLGGGDTLTLGGGSSLSGTIEGPGVLDTTTATSIAGNQLYAGDDLSWNNSGPVTQSASLQFGTEGNDTSGIINNSGATWNLTADAGIYDYFGSGVGFTNLGTFEMTGGTNGSTVGIGFTNDGTINVQTGTISFNGGGSFGGTLAGAGSLGFGGGVSVIVSGAKVTVANLDVSGGTLAISAALTAGAAISTSANLVIDANDDFTGGFSQSSGSLTISRGDVLTLAGAIGFSGDISGPGTLVTGGTAGIGDSALYVGGDLTWSNSGVIDQSQNIEFGTIAGDTAGITNQAGATWNVSSDAGILVYDGSNGGFYNAGTFEKSTSTNVSDVGIGFTNTGIIDAQTGTIDFGGGGNFGGTMEGGGTIDFGGGTVSIISGANISAALLNFTGGTSTIGAGANITSANLTVTDANLILDASAPSGASWYISDSSLALNTSQSASGGFIQVSGSILLGTGDVLALSGTANALSGTINGLGTLATSGTTSLTGGNLTVGGGLTWNNSGTVTEEVMIALGDSPGDTASISNQAGGVWDLSGDTGINDGSGGTAGFTNAGTMEHAGDFSTIAVAIVDTGTIEVASGTLEFADGGTYSGMIEGAGTIDFGGGANGIAANTSITAANLSFTGGSNSIAAGATVSSSYLTVSNAILSLGVSVPAAAGWLIENGILDLAASQTVTGDFTQTGGTISIAGGNKLALQGTVALSGIINGPGTLVTSGTISLTNSAITAGSGLIWNNSSAVTDSVNIGWGDLSTDSTTITNEAGAIWNLSGDAGFGYNPGSGGGFFNHGTLEKTAGSNGSTIGVAVTNTGTINAASGTINFMGGGSFGGTIKGAGTIDFGGGTNNFAGGVNIAVAALNFTGGVNIIASSANISSTSLTVVDASLSLAAAIPEAANWSIENSNLALSTSESVLGGFTQSGGMISIANGEFLALSGAAALSGIIGGSGTLITAGTTNLVADGVIAGSGLVWNNSGVLTDAANIEIGDTPEDTAGIDNLSGAVWNLTGNVVFSGSAGSGGFSNQGTLETSGNADDTIGVAVTNSGMINVAGGSIDFSGGGSFGGVLKGAGTVDFSAGTSTITSTAHVSAASLAFSGGSSTISAGASITSTNLAVSNATLVLDASLPSAANWSISNADLTLGANETVAGGLIQSGGTITIGGGNDLTMTGTGNLLSGAVVNDGEISINSGTLELGGNISGTGTLTIGAGAMLKLDVPASLTQTLINFGAGDGLDLVGVSIGSAVISGNELTVTTSAGAVYVFTGSQSLAGLAVSSVSDGSGGTDVVLYRLASASAATPDTVNFGNQHQGTVVRQAISIANSAAPDGYSENLDGGISANGGGAIASGGFTGLAAGQSVTALSAGLSCGSLGDVTAKATIALESDGSGVDGNGTTAIAGQTVTLTAKVYAYAHAKTASSVNLGVVHVGQSVTAALSLTNTTSNASYTEALDAILAGSSGVVTGNGADDVNLLAAGATDSSDLTYSVNTSADGVKSGTLTLGFTSDGTGTSGLGDTSLGDQTITVNVTVDHYAVAQLEKISGSGTLTATGANSFTLDLGSMLQYGSGHAAGLEIMNAAVGRADVLGGGFTVTNASGAFVNTGIGNFSGLAAGSGDAAPVIELSAATAGSFTETIVIDGAGSNASGYDGALTPITLTVSGIVAQTYTLTTGADVISAGAGNDLFIAASNTLSAGDNLNGGGGYNTLELSGGGNFNLGLPTTLARLQVVTAQEATGANAQTVTLRNDYTGTVNVASGGAGSSITITGANDSARINLGDGNDVVTVGAKTEVITGGGGNNVFNVTAATIGVTIAGGTGNNRLVVSGGGTVVMTDTISHVKTVSLDDAGVSGTIFVANYASGLAISGGEGNDTITVKSATQSVATGSGSSVVKAAIGNAGALVTTSGAAVLDLTTAGTATLNAADTGITVDMLAHTNLTLSKLGFITAVGTAGHDAITALAANQTLEGGVDDTLTGSSGFADRFVGTAYMLNGDIIAHFGGSDVIDLTNMNAAKLSALSWTSGNGSGVLSMTDGTHNSSITFEGNYSKADFAAASDGGTGTLISFV